MSEHLPSVNRTLGNRYRLRQLLGKGGAGSVYLAHDTTLNRFVAVKTINADVLKGLQNSQRGQDIIERLNREASTLASLKHPNIVHVYDYEPFTGNNEPFIVMEYLRGGTLEGHLSERVEAGKPMSIREVRRIIGAVADALHYCHNEVAVENMDDVGELTQHRRVVIHRDIKPSNIAFDDKQVPHLIDFSITRDLATESSITMGLVIGSPQYMAPELIDPATFKGVSTKTDQYALAVMAYYMLALEHPYDVRDRYGRKIESTTSKQYDTYFEAHTDNAGQPRSITTFNPKLSRKVQHVLERALKKSPDERYSSIKEFSTALDNALKWSPVTRLFDRPHMPRVGGGGTKDAPPPAPSPKRSPVSFVGVLVGLIVFLFVGAAVLILIESNRTDTPDEGIIITQTHEAQIALLVTQAIEETAQADATEAALADATTQAQSTQHADATQTADAIQQSADAEATQTAVVLQEMIEISTSIALTDSAIDAALTAQVEEASATHTSTATETAIPTETEPATETATATEQPSNTPTDAPTETATSTATATATEQPSSTPTNTEQPTETATHTATATATATEQPSSTPTNTEQPTETATHTATATATEQPSNTPQPTQTAVEVALVVTEVVTEEPTKESEDGTPDIIQPPITTDEPTDEPTEAATEAPTNTPTESPTDAPINTGSLPTPAAASARIDTGWVYFSSNMDTGANQELYAVGDDGGGLRRITFTDANNTHPALSPDGTRIAYITQIDDVYELRVVNAVGGRPSTLVQGTQPKSHPVWSPHGGTIIYQTLEDGGNHRLWLVDVSSGDVFPLTDGTFDAQAASWSPDGQTIVYQANPEGVAGLYTVSADGTDVQHIAQTSSDDLSPSWSPIGDEIAFYSLRDGGGLYIMNADGTDVRMIVPIEAVQTPTWLADGSGLVFCSSERQSQVYVMTLSTGNVISVTNNAAVNLCPSG